MARRVLINNRQLSYLLTEGKIDWLRTHYKVSDEAEWMKTTKNKSFDNKTKFVPGPIGPVAKIETNENGSEVISIGEKAFNRISEADPSPKKVFTQWLLELFVKMIKNNDYDSAGRFISEDIDGASSSLEKFMEASQSPKRFKERTADIEGLPAVINDIRQYTSIAQLSAAIEPYIEKADMTVLEDTIRKFASKGEAKIWLDDPAFMVWSPYTVPASRLELDSKNCLLTKKHGGLTDWCTAYPPDMNNHFDYYTTQNYKKPDGSATELFIYMSKGILNGTEKAVNGNGANIWQMHFESNQLKDANDHEIPDKLSTLTSNPKVEAFFQKVIGHYFTMASNSGASAGNNKYFKWLNDLGIGEKIFELMDTKIKRFQLPSGLKIKRIPPIIGEFTDTTLLTINGLGLEELPRELAKLPLTVLVATNNKISEIPVEITHIKKLKMLNLGNNPITHIPKEFIAMSDLNGGPLGRFHINKVNLDSESLKLYDTYYPPKSENL